VDNTNVSRRERQPIISLAHAHGARVIGYFFDVSTRVAVARNAQRSGRDKVPNVAIFSAAKRLEPPGAAEGFDRVFCVRPGPEETFVISDLDTEDSMAVTAHAEAVKRITRDELKSRLDEKRPMALVEALGPGRVGPTRGARPQEGDDRDTRRHEGLSG